MQKQEYDEKIKKIQQEEEKTNPSQTNIPQDDTITEEETKKLIKLADETIPQPEEEETETKQYKPSSILQKAPELKDFLQSKQAIQLGTKARIPVPIEIQGTIVKIYVRGISGEELAKIQQDSENTGKDPNHLAACLACTDSEGNPYPEEVLESLGYARERQIGEAITIASGENSEYTTENIQKQAIENLING